MLKLIISIVATCCWMLQPGGVLSVVPVVCGCQFAHLLAEKAESRYEFQSTPTHTHAGTAGGLHHRHCDDYLLSSRSCLTIQMDSPGTAWIQMTCSEKLPHVKLWNGDYWVFSVPFRVLLTVVACRIRTELLCSLAWKCGIHVCVVKEEHDSMNLQA